jgi:nodulation protein E
MNRVVITGAGVICAAGSDRAAFQHNIFEGRSGIGPVSLFDTSDFTVKVGGQVANYRPEDHFESARISLLDRFAQFALVAAREAIAESGLERNGGLGERAGLFHGTGIGGQSTQDASYLRLYGEKKSRLPPATVPKLIPSAATSHLSIEFGIRGPAVTTATACSAAGHAIASAVAMLRGGMIDIALAGGSEAPITPGCVRGWEALHVLAQDTCRPFSKDRTGTVLGEGGAFVVLETLSHAQARGARIHAELAGIGLSSDAFHPVQPDSTGIARAIRAALADAKVPPVEVDYVNAHGTGTLQNDAEETAAIKEIFGEDASRLAISSTKSMHGHTLGATSAIELIACLAALAEQRVPPTANYREPDPACDLDYVPNTARARNVKVVLNHSFAFGGMNAVSVLKRWPEA